MVYELECGHWGCAFTLDDGSLARSVKCPVCGGVLTVAVAVPMTAEPPPAPAPLPVPVPPPPPPRGGKYGFPGMPDRADPKARVLSPPWPAVRGGLYIVRAAVDVGLTLYVVTLLFALMALLALPEEDRSAVLRFQWFLAIPVVCHGIGQLVCIWAPRSCGPELAGGSVALLALTAIALLVLFPRGLAMVAVPAGLGVISGALWLGFLRRLGQGLSDRELIAAATADVRRFALGALGIVLLGVLTYLAEMIQTRLLVWGGRVGIAVIVFLMLRAYTALLHTAVAAIERHAPAVP